MKRKGSLCGIVKGYFVRIVIIFRIKADCFYAAFKTVDDLVIIIYPAVDNNEPFFWNELRKSSEGFHNVVKILEKVKMLGPDVQDYRRSGI